VNLHALTLGRFRRLVALRPRPRTTPRLNRRAAAVAVAVGVVVFAVLQLTLGVAAERSYAVKDPGYADKERNLERLEAANRVAPRVLMLGTSRTGFGFHAGRVEEQLAAEIGRPVVVFNYGIPASGPITHVVYARRLFARGHRPDLMLIEVLPPGLADLPDGPLESRFLFGDRLRRDEVETVIGYGFPERECRRAWRESVFEPWYALRFPIMGRVSPSAVPWHLRFDWSRTTDPHGWSTPLAETVTPEEYAVGLYRATHEYGAILADMHPAGGAARALGDLLALCRENGVPVRLVLMPESAGFRAIYPPHTTARLDAFLHRLCAEYGCGLIDARAWVPDTSFTDGHHLLRSGAETFSDRLYREAIRPFFRPPAP
jgi:hypothetical protein